MKYTCHICGYPNLQEKFFDGESYSSTHEICPSCGFHYGYDDMNANGKYPGKYRKDWDEKMIIESYRKDWIKSGMKYWSISPSHPQPPDWNPVEQLKNIGVYLDGKN